MILSHMCSTSMVELHKHRWRTFNWSTRMMVCSISTMILQIIDWNIIWQLTISWCNSAALRKTFSQWIFVTQCVQFKPLQWRWAASTANLRASDQDKRFFKRSTIALFTLILVINPMFPFLTFIFICLALLNLLDNLCTVLIIQTQTKYYPVKYYTVLHPLVIHGFRISFTSSN